MDIEEQQNNNNSDCCQQHQSATKSNHAYLRQSVKSKMSNQSLMSISQTKNHPDRVSFDSNISQKLKQKQNQKGLFQQLINDGQLTGIILHQTRTYGSNPNDYYMSRMSDQNNLGKIDQEKQNNLNSIESYHQNGIQYIDKIAQQQKIICKCYRSKCLLMYCQCFSKGLICNKQCSCYQCRNNNLFQQKRAKARQIVLEKNPNAFTNKLQVVGGQQTQLAHKRGCNCKKTHCSKKYCQCFNQGVRCTYLCHCEGCMNGGENSHKQ